jgi:hypothetical protein
MSNRGGKRAGAGNKVRYTFNLKLRIANEVTLIQRDLCIGREKALELLCKQGKLPPQYKAYERYLTPKYMRKDIIDILRESNRNGILAALPLLDSTKKKGV